MTNESRSTEWGILRMAHLNERQRMATDYAGDMVVTAGAGTGKTRTLVAHYLALLQKRVPLRRIVAITFTRKAAREMRNRVRGEIRRWLDAAPTDELDYWQSCYADLDVAYIGTIHGLCAAILQAHPAEAGIDPAFAELEEGASGVAKARAVESAMRWASSEAELFPLFQRLGIDGVTGTLQELLRQPLDASEALASSGADPTLVWEAAARRALLVFWEDQEVQAAIAELQSLLDDGSIDAAERARDKLAPVLRGTVSGLAQVAESIRAAPWQTTAAELTRLRKEMPLNVGSKRNWPDLEGHQTALRTIRQHFDAQIAPWTGSGSSWELDRACAQLLPPLRLLFERAVREYQAAKDERNALDFDDLERLALGLMETHPGVLARWQSRVEAVLVDEFQDTNARQRRLIDLLGAKGRRFIVGDAKQSIYRFRGADVTVFRDSQAAIVGGGGQHVGLHLTYRAHAALVDALNALLQQVLGETQTGRPYRVPFEPLVAAKVEPALRGGAPFVEIEVGAGQDAEEGRTVAARAAVTRIRALHDQHGIEFGDMAMLFRASTTFHYYEDALEQASIPYVTVAGRGFFDRPEVRDLINALTALADPTDEVAMVGLLRSPAIGLTDAAIYRLRRAPDGQVRQLKDALRDARDELADDDRGRAERAWRLLASLHDMVGRLPVATVLKRFLDETAYVAITRLSGDERARRNIDKLLSSAHRSQQVSVSGFLEYVRSIRDVAAREGEAAVEAEGAVQLMTIHQSKGLEFPVVVLADLGRSDRGGAGAVQLSRELGPLLRLSDEEVKPCMYLLGKLEEQDKDDAESDRLLYVAATRAAERLILNGHVTVTGEAGKGKLGCNGWLKRICSIVGLSLDPDGIDMAQPTQGVTLPSAPWAGADISTPALDAPQSLVEAEGAPAADQQARPLPHVAPLRARVLCGQAPEQEGKRVWRVVPMRGRRSAPAWVVGELVHEALRRWRFPGAPGLDEMLRTAARGQGLVDAGLAGDAVSRAVRLLRRFQGSTLCRDIDGADECYHELPYEVLDQDGAPDHRVIDVLYRRGDAWTIVEFKTDYIKSPDELRQRIAVHQPQVDRYVLALNGLLGTQPKALLCFLQCATAVGAPDGIHVYTVPTNRQLGP